MASHIDFMFLGPSPTWPLNPLLSASMVKAQKLIFQQVNVNIFSASFEDSVHLYRWADETVVREAKRMVSTNSSHIPKKRLIEMIDMGQGSGSENTTSVKVMIYKGRVADLKTPPASR